MQQYHRYLMIVAAAALVGAGMLIAQAFRAAPPPPVMQAPPPAPVQTSQVLVAKSDLTAGQFLQESDFTWRDRPTTALRPELYVKGADSTVSLVGAVLLHAVAQGEAVQRGDVVSPRDRGFLAAVLAPDKRSITVAVDEVTGNAGLILPGDRVDLLVIHTGGQAENPARQVVAQVVLEDVRVIAVDQSMRSPSEEIKDAKEAQRGLHLSSPGSAHGPEVARTVTLEVSPHEAEVVAVAANLGRLTLTLRSLTHAGPAPSAANRAAVWAGEVMQSLADLGAAPALATTSSHAAAEPAPAGVVVLRGGGGQTK